MKAFWKYIFPALYGLLVYFTIRLLLDSAVEQQFWRRPLLLNTIEIITCIITGYIIIGVLNRLISYFNQTAVNTFNYRNMGREVLYVIIATQVIVNVIITTMASVTDNGLQWVDVFDINTIPLMYALIYYSIRRSNNLLQAYVENRIQLEKITNDKLQTELKFLKAQYHPHFLFNALNTIYFQMDTDIAATKRTVEKFSELLRYQLYDQQQTVSIGNEIRHLQNFIDLQQVRSSSKLQLQVDFDNSIQHEQVYPLLLLPLVENAFKYVGGDYHLRITLKKEGHHIIFTVENSIPAEIPIERTGGIGQENLKRRLELLYPDNHTFTAQMKDHSFLAELRLTLNHE
ncbi:MAG TPA: sensor histidine kinase [Chitinophaga sp.]|uniref:sensor histidine kinase n=1 Tax=Chitinophaga sp. TaxID=1869181 RepID=UPI002B54BEBA|nr:sensor histidine kinase [Chitinophaga sp.]HVI46393.1 sensor histidine kinase [Chitinophaga sp.]